MRNKVFELYLLKGMILHSIISMLILSSIFLIFKTFDIFSDPQFSNASSLELSHLAFLNLPTIMYQLNASSILIGTIFFISRNHEENEFIVFFSSGLSKEYIAKKIFFIALLFSFFTAVLGELTMPNFEERIIKFKSYLTGTSQVKIYSDTQWGKDENNFFKIYSEEEIPELRRIKFYAFDDQQNLKDVVNATLSKDNTIQEINDFLRLELVNDQVKFTELEPRKFKYQLGIDSDKQKITNGHSKIMSIHDLLMNIRNLKGYDYIKKIYEIEILSRIIKPVTIATLLLLTIPKLLNFSRTSSVSRTLFKSIFLAVLINFIVNLIESVSLRFELNHLILIVLPTIILLTYGLFRVNNANY